MVTIKTEIKTSGNSLMKNKTCEVVIKPSQEGKIRIFSKGADVGFDADIAVFNDDYDCLATYIGGKLFK